MQKHENGSALKSKAFIFIKSINYTDSVSDITDSPHGSQRLYDEEIKRSINLISCSLFQNAILSPYPPKYEFRVKYTFALVFTFSAYTEADELGTVNNPRLIRSSGDPLNKNHPTIRPKLSMEY